MAYSPAASFLLTRILLTAEDGEDDSRYGEGFEALFEKARAWRDHRGRWLGTDKEAQVLLKQVAAAVYSDSEDFSYGDNFDDLFAEVTSLYPSDRQHNPGLDSWGGPHDIQAGQHRLDQVMEAVTRELSDSLVFPAAGSSLSRAYDRAQRARDRGTPVEMADAEMRLRLVGKKAGLTFRYLGRQGNPGEPEIYCSTYCNFGHRMKDGRPVEHECRVIPPAALRAERAGDYDKAIEIMGKGTPRHHFGRRTNPSTASAWDRVQRMTRAAARRYLGGPGA